MNTAAPNPPLSRFPPAPAACLAALQGGQARSTARSSKPKYQHRALTARKQRFLTAVHTLRPINEDGFGKKPDMSGKFHAGGVGYGPKTELEGWRSSWEILCNEALERAGSDARIDHRSLADRGIDREPEPKIGVEAIGMQRRGAEEDPNRVRDVRQVRMENDLLPEVRSVRQSGEVALQGEDETTLWTRMRDNFSYLAAEWKAFLRDESSGGRPTPEEEQQRSFDVSDAAHKPEVEPVWARRGPGGDVRPLDHQVEHEPER